MLLGQGGALPVTGPSPGHSTRKGEQLHAATPASAWALGHQARCGEVAPGARWAGRCRARNPRRSGQGCGSGTWPAGGPSVPDELGPAAPGPPTPARAAGAHARGLPRAIPTVAGGKGPCSFSFPLSHHRPLTKASSGAWAERSAPGDAACSGAWPGSRLSTRTRATGHSTAHSTQGPEEGSRGA